MVVGQTKVWIEIDGTKLMEALLERKPDRCATFPHHRPNPIKLAANFLPVRRGGELLLVAPKTSSSEGSPVPALVKAIARARNWYEQIIVGEVGAMNELAQKTGLTSTYVKRILQCAMLSPRTTERILSGKHQADLTLQKLLDNIPIDWREQEQSSILEE